MEREKNEIISLYAKNDKMQSACIQQLQRKLALESERIEQLELLVEYDEKTKTILKELHDNEKHIHEKVIRLLKEQVAILEKAQN